jgi:dienelactone hydrolase
MARRGFEGFAALALAASLSAAARAGDGPFDRPNPAEPRPRPKSETATFPTADAVTVSATWWPAGPPGGPALVLVPMEGTTRDAWDPLVPALVEHGIAALAVDLRGPSPPRVAGAKAPPLPPAGSADFYATMHEDVAAAVRFAVEKGADPGRVGLLGAGLGASVALDHARRAPDAVDVLALLTVGLDHPGLPSEAHAKALRGDVPVLLLSSVEDIDRGTKKLLYLWERERGPPPLTPAREREAARRGVAPRLRALAPTGVYGTRMLSGKVPHLDAWLAAWFARHWGTRPLPVLFDGSVDRAGDFGDASWEKGVPLRAGMGVTGRALRWGRRVMVGAEVPDECVAARVRLVLRRGGRQLDVSAVVNVATGTVEASALTLRDGPPRPAVPVEALALEGQPGYEGVAPVKPSFEVEVRFPEIEDGEGGEKGEPYRVFASLLVERRGGDPEGDPAIHPTDPSTWPEVPDAEAR